MDELALLKSFRLDDAAPDGAREHARAALSVAMTRRRRLPRRRYTIAIAFVLAAVLAAAAYAIVHQFVIGSTAPEPVRRDIGMHLAVANGEPIPFHTPYELTGPPVIAAAAHTPAGMVYLLLGRIAGGGDCQFVWFADRRTPTGGAITEGSCRAGKAVPRKFGYALERSVTAKGAPYTLVLGFAPGATRVRIGDRFFKTPFGWFVAAYDRPALLTAYGAHGGVVSRVQILPGGQPTPPTPARLTVPLAPLGTPHVFVTQPMGWIQTDIRVTPAGRTFKWLDSSHRVRVSATRSNKGGACIYVDVDPRALPDPRCLGAKPNEIHAFPTPVGWTMSRHRASWGEGEAVLGAAGRNISRVDVRFSDGRSAPAHVYGRAIFYLVPRANYAAGHRPKELVGRDANGRIVARTPLPYIG